MTDSQEVQHERHPTFLQYVVVAILLFAITIVEFLLIWDRAGIVDNLGASKVPLLIGLSTVKFAVVIMFYMHLKFESWLFSGVFLAGLVLAFAVGIALLSLFVALGGEPREFAEANAVAFAHEDEDAHGDEAPIAAGGPLSITTEGDAIKFSVGNLTAKAGGEVVLTFTNGAVTQSHNWVLVRAEDKVGVVADGTGAGPENDWIKPDDPRVIAHTKLLGPEESQELRFPAPPVGAYQFVCTYPGHASGMTGELQVTP